MKKAFLFAALLGLPYGQIPGIPYGCCGYQNCRPARVRILNREPGGLATVSVDGVRIRIHSIFALQTTKTRSWYCYKENKPKCAGGMVSEECARCAIQAESLTKNEVEVIGAEGHRKLVLEMNRPCASCHAERR